MPACVFLQVVLVSRFLQANLKFRGVAIKIVTRHNINFDRKEIVALLAHILGPQSVDGEDILQFEEEFASYHGVRYAVAFASARSALYSILSSMDLKSGSEVIVPSYSFFSVPNVVEALGFTPVFAKNHPFNFAIDPEFLEQSISSRTSAIVVEHPFGQMAPIKEILEIADKHGLPVIEDPSQSIGAKLDDKPAGSFALAATSSLVHGKNLTTLGGGMAITDDEQLYRGILEKSIKADSYTGMSVRMKGLGGLLNFALATKKGFTAGPFLPFYLLNLISRKKLEAIFDEEPEKFVPSSVKRLSNLQAVLGRMQLERLDARNDIRRRNAEYIISGLRDVKQVKLPEVIDGCRGTWNALPIRVENSIEFQHKLFVRGVDSRSDYMTLYDHHNEWKKHGEVLYLPSHPAMDQSDCQAVVETVKKIV